MARLCVPQSTCAGLDVDGRRYEARKGYVDVPDHLVGRLKKNAECFSPSQQPRAAGFVCASCGFNALIRTCGRCGGTCHRPGEQDGQAA